MSLFGDFGLSRAVFWNLTKCHHQEPGECNAVHHGSKNNSEHCMNGIDRLSLYVHPVWLGGGAGLHVCCPAEVYSTVAGSQPPAQRHTPALPGRLLSEHAQSAAATGAKCSQEVHTHTQLCMWITYIYYNHYYNLEIKRSGLLCQCNYCNKSIGKILTPGELTSLIVTPDNNKNNLATLP